MKRKQLSLFVAFLFLFVLIAGCTQESVPETTPTPTQESKATTTPKTESKLEEKVEVTGFKLPLVEEMISFDVWIPGSPPATTRLENEDDNISIQAVEKLTNVHINRIRPGGANAQEAFNLSVTSGDFPD